MEVEEVEPTTLLPLLATKGAPTMCESKTANAPPCDADAILQSMREPLLVLDDGLRVTAAIRSFYDTFKATPEQTLGRSLYELGNGQWNIPALRELLDGPLPGGPFA